MARKSEPKPIETLTYRVRADGWVAGHFRKKGAEVSLTATAARYENVEETTAKATKAEK